MFDNIEIDNFINKITCGDCLDVMPKLPDECIDLIIADPPYLTTDEKWDQEESFGEKHVNEFFRLLKPTGNLYVWCGIGEKSQSLIRWFPAVKEKFYFKDLITWKKRRGYGMRKGWLYTREEIMWWVKDNKQFVWNDDNQYHSFSGTSNRAKEYSKKTGHGARITNVWTDITETFLRGNDKYTKGKFHFTAKPIETHERIILLHTQENELVLDPYFGSGTTGEAAINLNRNFIGIEKEQKYCDAAQDRLSNLTRNMRLL